MPFNQWVGSIADAGRELMNRGEHKNSGRSVREMCADLCSSKGEAMGTAIAHEVVTAYNLMDEAGKLDFFQMLLKDYSADKEAIIRCADEFKEKADEASYQALNAVVEGPRRNLFRNINMAPNGTLILVRMREDLLKLAKRYKELKAVDADMFYLLKSWFNRGFLRLETISWETPAHLLEKLIAYEAVHEMQGWDDLRRRLAEDRRCFAFFHPALPDEPLIFVQVALVKGIAGNVQELLAEPTEEPSSKFDTAIFYSISNCQEGLKGISFGNFLIKQVVLELQKEFPQLKNFATLSPIPGFDRWLTKQLESGDVALINDDEVRLLDHIKTDNWYTDKKLADQLEPLLMRLCAYYLNDAKRGDHPLDPVERFHLGNGACIERLNWLADTSKNGLAQSAGMLVNYGYHLKKVEESHEAYINDNAVVTSSAFQKFLR